MAGVNGRLGLEPLSACSHGAPLTVLRLAAAWRRKLAAPRQVKAQLQTFVATACGSRSGSTRTVIQRRSDDAPRAIHPWPIVWYGTAATREDAGGRETCPVVKQPRHAHTLKSKLRAVLVQADMSGHPTPSSQLNRPLEAGKGRRTRHADGHQPDATVTDHERGRVEETDSASSVPKPPYKSSGRRCRHNDLL